LLVSCEGLQVVEVMTKEQCDFVSCAVAAPDPHDFRWRPKEKAPLMKIGVLRHDGQFVFNGIVPYNLFVCCMQRHISNVDRARVEITDEFDKPRGDCGRRAGSFWRNRRQLALAISGKRKTGADVFPSEVGKIGEEFVFGDPGGKVFEDLVHGGPQSANTGLASSLFWLDGNAVSVSHGRNLRQRGCLVNHRRALRTFLSRWGVDRE
jgi:hypothetical protein